MSKPEVVDMATMHEYEIENDLDTLLRAEKVKADSKRYKAAKALARKKRKQMAALTGDAGSSKSK